MKNPRKIAKRTLFLAAASIAVATISCNIYLMTHRPVMTRVIPEKTPANWICQRVLFDSYCVQITTADQSIYHLLLALMVLFSVPVMMTLGLLHQLRSADEA